MSLTRVPASHEKHGDVTSRDRKGANPNDVPHHNTPPWSADMQETFSGTIYKKHLSVMEVEVLCRETSGAPACQALMQHTIVAMTQGGLRGNIQ